MDESVQAELAVGQVLPNAEADERWWQTVCDQIQEEEYNASVAAGGLQAPNRANNLRTYFREGGIEVVPRIRGEQSSWRFSWRTSHWGRPGNLAAAVMPESGPVSDGSRVTYARRGLTEWYENGEEGLEQGFTVTERPEGSGELWIRGEWGGNLRAEMQAEGRAIDFLDEQGVRLLRYGAVHVEDARGAELPSRITLEGGTLTLVIEDTGAQYPLVVDPLLTSPSWTAESDQAFARFGWSVATAGDVNGDGYSDVIVGADSYDGGEVDEGRAYVYHGTSGGLVSSAAWTAESNESGSHFGSSVGTAGDVNGDGYADVIVGAKYYDTGGIWQYYGRAYVYHGSSGGLEVSAAWTDNGDQDEARFGSSVGTAGDVNGDGYADVIVGAPGYDNDYDDEGRVYVYHGSSEGLDTNEAWTAESNQASAGFGRAVGTAGDVDGDGYADVIIGASGYDHGEWQEGRAYVYLGSQWGLASSAAWTAESNQQNAYFGNSVGTAGDVDGDGYADVVVGAIDYSNGQDDEGRVFVYHGSAGGLESSAAWTGEGNQDGANFGHCVGTAGDVNGDGYADIAIGVPQWGTFNAGRVAVYQGSSEGLSPDATWTRSSTQDYAHLGWSVGTAGDVNGDGYSDVIVGASYYDNGQEDEGQAYVFHGCGGGLEASAAWAVESNQEFTLFGSSVGTAGDVNGDGYSDVIVGAPIYDGGQTSEGRAYVYHGSPGGLAVSAAWAVESNQERAYFGSSVGTAGDVNGDGYADVIVGASRYDNGQLDEGEAFVYQGSSAGLATNAAWTAEGDQEDGSFGSSVGTAGDVNGDGYSDVIVGASRYDNGQSDEGRAFVYHGSSAGLATSAIWTAESDQDDAAFGVSVGTAGDVNGDGYSDVIVGASSYDLSHPNEGKAYVYHGSTEGLEADPAWTKVSMFDNSYFGRSVGTAGDVNGDGYADVIIGAYRYGIPFVDAGRAYVYHGSSGGGLSGSAAWTVTGDQEDARLGISVGTAGDVNGDGYSDIVIGAYHYDNGETLEGRAYVYRGSPGGIAGDATWTVESDLDYSELGESVGMAGDVNGDGYSDVIIGAHRYSNSETYEGQASVYYGNGGDGLDRIPRQARKDNYAPIAVLGLSDSGAGFRMKALGRTPAGRGRVCLQYEVKPAGTPFDGMGLITGSVFDTGMPSGGGSAVALEEVVTGLLGNSLHHWRLRTVSDSPFFPRSPWFSLPDNAITEADVRTPVPSGITAEVAPAHLILGPGAPNPFGSSIRLDYTLTAAGQVQLIVFDVTGRELAVLVNSERTQGRHTAYWDGTSSRGARVPAGVYFVRLRVNDWEETGRIVLGR
ncbi:MAG: FG-GAP repeat protein [Candidatus Eisenbacteria sp.]|nr:FG-GAP repeat protein [Candidatus Eisenbacteria bacterium]